MGCWTETCILSKLPIEEGELCYMFTGNDLLDMLFDADDTKFIIKKPYYLKISLGIYNGYGTLENVERIEDSFFVNPNVWNWLLYKYDYLVNIHCHPTTKEHYREEYNSMVKFCFSSYNYTDEYKGTLNYLEQYIKTSYVCTRLRLCPNSLNVSGSQDIDYKSYKEWLQILIDITNNKIEKDKELNE